MIGLHTLHSPHQFTELASLGDRITACLITPSSSTGPWPVVIASHGAGEFKENYYELADHLADRGIATLALDMHGHGSSGGRAGCVDMEEWVADLNAALDWIETQPALDPKRVSGFGLSSGGTAILEAGAQHQRFHTLIALDATVMDTLPKVVSWSMHALKLAGYASRALTGDDLRINLVSMLKDLELASDPEINGRLQRDPGKLKAFGAFPLPGAADAFLVDTIKRVPAIQCPTLVIWGEDDKLDPVSTARHLFDTLRCEKALELVPGNGHAGHLDRNRGEVFRLTGDWIQKHC